MLWSRTSVHPDVRDTSASLGQLSVIDSASGPTRYGLLVSGCTARHFIKAAPPSRTSRRSRKSSDFPRAETVDSPLKGNAVFVRQNKGTPGFLGGVFTCTNFLEDLFRYRLLV
jgi:hypothetical protein